VKVPADCGVDEQLARAGRKEERLNVLPQQLHDEDG